MDESSPTKVLNRSNTIVRRQLRPLSGKKAARWPSIIISLILGTILWFGIDTKRMQEASLEVDLAVEQVIPAGWRITTLSANKINVTIRGARQANAAILQDAIMVQPTIPREAFDGDVFEGTLGLTPSQVRGLPPGIQVLDVNPSTITVRFDKVVTRYLPVEPGEITGQPAAGFVVGRVGKPEPQDMPITGPKTLLDNISHGDVIKTTNINVEGLKGPVTDWVKPLPFEKNGVTIPLDGTISVTVDLVEAPVVKTLEQPIDVKALIDSPFDRYNNITLSPPVVKVTVSGSQNTVDNLNPGEIVVYADIRDRLPAAPGEYTMRCRTLAPDKIKIVKVEPDSVKWVLHDNAPVSENAPEAVTEE